jgi:hypothetical protein
MNGSESGAEQTLIASGGFIEHPPKHGIESPKTPEYATPF